MNIQDSIGELLYIGIVAEKGRCYGMRWKKNYKKNLKTHIRALNKLQIVLKSNDINEIKNCVNDFINMCKKNSNFGKFYNFKVDYVDSFLLVNIILKLKNCWMIYLMICFLNSISFLYLKKKFIIY